MGEGKVTLTCGHTNETPVCIWEPEIDRHGNRCRSYATYCPACAEDASLVMVKRIEELEAKLAKAVEALFEAVYLLDPSEEDIAKKAALYRIVKTFKELKGGE